MAVDATVARRFGWVIHGDVGLRSGVWDEPVYQSANFVVMPSLGSLVPGWLVAVPRQPLINLSHLAQAKAHELESLVAHIISQYRRAGTDWFMFEHGAVSAGSLVGCGVDQAHLHLVPLPFDLLFAAKSDVSGDVRWSTPRQGRMLSELPSHEYVAVSHPKSRRYLVGEVVRPSSQWMRRVIARHLESANRWDYRQHPEIENIRLTIREAKRMLTK